jgi:hypothetical protein
MKKYFSVFVFLLISTHPFSQKPVNFDWEGGLVPWKTKLKITNYDQAGQTKVYRIWTNYQLIELVKTGDSIYSGQVVNFVTKEGKAAELVFEKHKITTAQTRSLMEALRKENIESLRSCDEVPGYLLGTDGITYIFEIINDKKKRIYFYWMPMSQLQKNEIKEVRSVQNIYHAVDKIFPLDDNFIKFRNQLPKGVYYYGTTQHVVK